MVSRAKLGRGGGLGGQPIGLVSLRCRAVQVAVIEVEIAVIQVDGSAAPMIVAAAVDCFRLRQMRKRFFVESFETHSSWSL